MNLLGNCQKFEVFIKNNYFNQKEVKLRYLTTHDSEYYGFHSSSE